MKAKELKEILLEQIENGVYNETKKLPTEDQLIKTYGVTRYSVRRVIEELAEMCIVYQVQGSGVYIRENRRSGYLSLSSTRGISNEFIDKNVSTKLISMNLEKATEKDMELFKCDENTEIYNVIRLRHVDNNPFALEFSRYNKKLVPYLNKEIAESSIFNYIQDALKLNIGFADKIIESRKITEYEAELLELEKGDPAIIINDTVYLKSGEIFDCSSVVYNFKYAKFFDLAIFKKQRTLKVN